jgi:serine/threonine protein kinase
MAGLENPSSSEKLYGSYILGEQIGRGGFGKVYKARHSILQTPACIKILSPNQQGDDLDGVLREALILTALRHDHIVRFIDLNKKDGQIYLIMEYIDGGDLASALKQAPDPFPLEEVDALIQQIADGLHYLHQNHIIHRDLKLANILREKSGRVIIADFGLAKWFDPDNTQALQSGRAGAGTPAYMAPEQCLGKPEYRSDLYSLGVIAYELLTKQRPFTGEPLQVMRKHVEDDPPPLHNFNPNLPPEIEQVVFKMLAKKPEERYQSALDFARDLQSAIKRRDLKIRVVPEPGNPGESLAEQLRTCQEGAVIRLEPGEYKGPFSIAKRVHLIGDGPSTKLYTIDEPVVQISTSGVRLEHLMIQRARESSDEPVIQPAAGISYTLRHATIVGGPTPGAQWEDTEWQLPVDGIDFGRIPVDSQQARTIPIEVKEDCDIKTDMPGLEVFPRHLPQGTHTLKLAFNASERPPGSRLTGSVILEGKAETRVLPIICQIDQPTLRSPAAQGGQLFDQSTLLSPPAQKGQPLTPMEWSYRLRDEAAKAVLRELGGDAGRKLLQQDLANRRNRDALNNRASSLLFELAGRRALLWYLRRREGDAQYPDQERWELTLAADNPDLPSGLLKKESTMCLGCSVARRGGGKLLITSVRFPGVEAGFGSRFALPVLVRLAPSIPEDDGIAQAFIDQVISKLPALKSSSTLGSDQVHLWEALLNFQEDQAKKRQYWVKYTNHDYQPGATKISFDLNREDIKNWEQAPIPYQDFEVLARQSIGEDIELFDALPQQPKSGKRGDRGLILGTLQRFDAARGKFEIDLAKEIRDRLDDGTYSLPKAGEGYLHFRAGGDLTQIKRQRDALATLQRDPWLADFFFDARKARVYGAAPKLSPGQLLSGTCNSGQIAAVEAALAPRDLLLIQGPPGTGKTTVIAEICYQVALRGERALIASQSNLAVDNALGRLIHHPSVRALRKGNPHSVEKEGEEFTEKCVVEKWLEKTARDCERRLKQRQENIRRLKALLSAVERFSEYVKAEEAWDQLQATFRRRLAAAIQEITEIEALITLGEAKAQKYTAIQHGLSALLAGNAEWDSPETQRALGEAYRYLLELVGQEKMRGYVEWMQWSGLILSEGNLLRSIAWLKEHLPGYRAAWTESNRLISQMGEELDRLSKADQHRRELEDALQARRRRLQQLDAQIPALKYALQNHERASSTLERVAAALYRLPQNGPGSVAENLYLFINAELHSRLAAPGPLSRLEPGKVFPPEIMTAIREDAFPMFGDDWRSAESDLYKGIQWAIGQGNLSHQVGHLLSFYRQQLEQELAALPEISQELGRARSGGYATVMQQHTTDMLLLNQIGEKLKRIQAMRLQPTGILDRFFPKRTKQQLLMLFQETRDLLDIVHQRQASLPTLISNANYALAARIAAELTASLQRWLTQRRQAVADIQQQTRAQLAQLESDYQLVPRLLADEEAQLAQTNRELDERRTRLTALLQQLGGRTDMPEELRRKAQDSARALATAWAELQSYRTTCQQWAAGIPRLNDL